MIYSFLSNEIKSTSRSKTQSNERICDKVSYKKALLLEKLHYLSPKIKVPNFTVLHYKLQNFAEIKVDAIQSHSRK